MVRRPDEVIIDLAPAFDAGQIIQRVEVGAILNAEPVQVASEEPELVDALALEQANAGNRGQLR